MIKELLDNFEAKYMELQKKERVLYEAYRRYGRCDYVKTLEQELKEDRKLYREIEHEAGAVLDSLPTGRGKGALIMHYMGGKTYVKRAEELGIGVRHLMRLVKETLEAGEKYEG